MTIFFIFISFLYSILILAFIYGFRRVAEFKVKESIPKTKFSIVIPFRNEELNLPILINSIKKLNYPKSHFEVIFIDDNSYDNSVSIINSSIENNWIILKNKENTFSPKKDAITLAINESRYNWIITTDADCIVPYNWLYTFDNFIQQNEYKLIAAPVKYFGSKSFLDKFQVIDFLSLSGSTIGSFGLQKPIMANGANLAYEKEFFLNLNAYHDNKNIASGDDIFLLQKAQENYPNHVAFLKSTDVVVVTKPQPNWPTLINQRIRWASKSANYKNPLAIVTGIIVLVMNMLVVSMLLLLITRMMSIKEFITVIFIKIIIDAILIYQASGFLDQKIKFSTYLVSGIFYPFFISLIAVLSTFKSYNWKERVFNK